MLRSSKIHHAGAETRNKPTYLCGLRLSKDVPVRQKTRPSMVRQYPSHSGKKPQCVRGPCSVQLRVQKRMIRLSPIHACQGSVDLSVATCLFLIFVVIPQVYTEIPNMNHSLQNRTRIAFL